MGTLQQLTKEEAHRRRGIRTCGDINALLWQAGREDPYRPLKKASSELKKASSASSPLEHKAGGEVLDGQHALHAVQVVALHLHQPAQPVVDLQRIMDGFRKES